MKSLIKGLFVVLAINLYAKIQFVPVLPTPQPENVKMYIVFPQKNQVLDSDVVAVQLKLRGYPIGIMTENDRGKEIANASIGQSMHVIIDNNPYFPRIGPSIDPYDEDENYYESQYKFYLPMKLSQGKHYIRVFPARSYGESLKEEGSYIASEFYVQNKRNNENVNLSDPYLTYNEPSGYIKLSKDEPVLLDFLISNCNLSADGFKVKVTLDNDTERLITLWAPFYIYGLQKGKHTIRLELVDKNAKLVPGIFNDVTRNFYVN